MDFEKSCGAVVYYRQPEECQYLVIKHRNNGHWGFPKGHVEKGELERDTALREIAEETGLKVRLVPGFRHKIEYAPKEGIRKEVVFFLAEASHQAVMIQDEEVEEYKWLPFNKAYDLITFSNSKNMLAKAKAFLKNERL